MGYDARAMVGSDWSYCEEILPKVSRTFALNIGQLQGQVYRAVLLGYLLFRIADTLEDTVCLGEEAKICALERYASVFRGTDVLNEQLTVYEPLRHLWHEDSAEKDLIERGGSVIRCSFDLPERWRRIIGEHIARTAEGMVRFQRRKLESGVELFQLRDMADLEDYCYQVAGIVGEMLTHLFCQVHDVAAVREELERHQVDFGLGLQTTNIIKDCAKDVGRGWCYIPASVTGTLGVGCEEVGRLSATQHKEIVEQFMPVIVGYYDSALYYIVAIPEEERPIRLFCLIAFVLAYNTLLHVLALRGSKLPRSEVVALLGWCESLAGSNDLLQQDYANARQRLLA